MPLWRCIQVSKVAAVIVAAGRGTRMGLEKSKQFLHLEGHMIIARTLKVFQESGVVDQVVLVVSQEDLALGEETVARYGLNKVQAIVPGGKERCHSVYQGLQTLPSDCSLVVVHDGVRPFLTGELLARAVEEAKRWGPVAVGVPVKDTVKICDEDGLVLDTPPREKLWAIQTPQVFPLELLQDSYQKALEIGLIATDDTAVLGYFGYPVKIIMGDYSNIKITTPEDLDLASRILERRKKNEGGDWL
jgi:2-C-methyl-D-erythritol 4-phosphate cytidylyltransferase